MKSEKSILVPVLIDTSAVLLFIVLVQANTINTMKTVPTYKIENFMVQERTNLPELHQVYEPRTKMGFKFPSQESEKA